MFISMNDNECQGWQICGPVGKGVDPDTKVGGRIGV